MSDDKVNQNFEVHTMSMRQIIARKGKQRIIGCDADDDPHEVLETMLEHGLVRIPVLGEHGKLLGIAELADVQKYCAEDRGGGQAEEQPPLSLDQQAERDVRADEDAARRPRNPTEAALAAISDALNRKPEPSSPSGMDTGVSG